MKEVQAPPAQRPLRRCFGARWHLGVAAWRPLLVVTAASSCCFSLVASAAVPPWKQVQAKGARSLEAAVDADPYVAATAGITRGHGLFVRVWAQEGDVLEARLFRRIGDNPYSASLALVFPLNGSSVLMDPEVRPFSAKPAVEAEQELVDLGVVDGVRPSTRGYRVWDPDSNAVASDPFLPRADFVVAGFSRAETTGWHYWVAADLQGTSQACQASTPSSPDADTPACTARVALVVGPAAAAFGVGEMLLQPSFAVDVHKWEGIGYGEVLPAAFAGAIVAILGVWLKHRQWKRDGSTVVIGALLVDTLLLPSVALYCGCAVYRFHVGLVFVVRGMIFADFLIVLIFAVVGLVLGAISFGCWAEVRCDLGLRKRSRCLLATVSVGALFALGAGVFLGPILGFLAAILPEEGLLVQLSHKMICGPFLHGMQICCPRCMRCCRRLRGGNDVKKLLEADLESGGDGVDTRPPTPSSPNGGGSGSFDYEGESMTIPPEATEAAAPVSIKQLLESMTMEADEDESMTTTPGLIKSLMPGYQMSPPTSPMGSGSLVSRQSSSSTGDDEVTNPVEEPGRRAFQGLSFPPLLKPPSGAPAPPPTAPEVREVANVDSLGPMIERVGSDMSSPSFNGGTPSPSSTMGDWRNATPAGTMMDWRYTTPKEPFWQPGEWGGPGSPGSPLSPVSPAMQTLNYEGSPGSDTRAGAPAGRLEPPPRSSSSASNSSRSDTSASADDGDIVVDEDEVMVAASQPHPEMSPQSGGTTSKAAGSQLFGQALQLPEQWNYEPHDIWKLPEPPAAEDYRPLEVPSASLAEQTLLPEQWPKRAHDEIRVAPDKPYVPSSPAPAVAVAESLLLPPPPPPPSRWTELPDMEDEPVALSSGMALRDVARLPEEASQTLVPSVEYPLGSSSVTSSPASPTRIGPSSEWLETSGGLKANVAQSPDELRPHSHRGPEHSRASLQPSDSNRREGESFGKQVIPAPPIEVPAHAEVNQRPANVGENAARDPDEVRPDSDRSSEHSRASSQPSDSNRREGVSSGKQMIPAPPIEVPAHAEFNQSPPNVDENAARDPDEIRPESDRGPEHSRASLQPSDSNRREVESSGKQVISAPPIEEPAHAEFKQSAVTFDEMGGEAISKMGTGLAQASWPLVEEARRTPSPALESAIGSPAIATSEASPTKVGSSSQRLETVGSLQVDEAHSSQEVPRPDSRLGPPDFNSLPPPPDSRRGDGEWSGKQAILAPSIDAPAPAEFNVGLGTIAESAGFFRGSGVAPVSSLPLKEVSQTLPPTTQSRLGSPPRASQAPSNTIDPRFQQPATFGVLEADDRGSSEKVQRPDCGPSPANFESMRPTSEAVGGDSEWSCKQVISAPCLEAPAPEEFKLSPRAFAENGGGAARRTGFEVAQASSPTLEDFNSPPLLESRSRSLEHVTDLGRQESTSYDELRPSMPEKRAASKVAEAFIEQHLQSSAPFAASSASPPTLPDGDVASKTGSGLAHISAPRLEEMTSQPLSESRSTHFENATNLRGQASSSCEDLIQSQPVRSVVANVVEASVEHHPHSSAQSCESNAAASTSGSRLTQVSSPPLEDLTSPSLSGSTTTQVANITDLRGQKGISSEEVFPSMREARGAAKVKDAFSENHSHNSAHAGGSDSSGPVLRRASISERREESFLVGAVGEVTAQPQRYRQPPPKSAGTRRRPVALLESQQSTAHPGSSTPHVSVAQAWSFADGNELGPHEVHRAKSNDAGPHEVQRATTSPTGVDPSGSLDSVGRLLSAAERSYTSESVRPRKHIRHNSGKSIHSLESHKDRRKLLDPNHSVSRSSSDSILKRSISSNRPQEQVPDTPLFFKLAGVFSQTAGGVGRTQSRETYSLSETLQQGATSSAEKSYSGLLRDALADGDSTVCVEAPPVVAGEDDSAKKSAGAMDQKEAHLNDLLAQPAVSAKPRGQPQVPKLALGKEEGLEWSMKRASSLEEESARRGPILDSNVQPVTPRYATQNDAPSSQLATVDVWPPLRTFVQQVTPREKTEVIQRHDMRENLDDIDAPMPLPRLQEELVPTRPPLQTVVRQVTPRGGTQGEEACSPPLFVKESYDDVGLRRSPPRSQEQCVPTDPLLQTIVRQVTPRGASPVIGNEFVQNSNDEGSFVGEGSSEPQARSEEKLIPTGPLLQTMLRQVTPRGGSPHIEKYYCRDPNLEASLVDNGSSEPHARSGEKSVRAGPALHPIVRQVTPRGAGPGVEKEFNRDSNQTLEGSFAHADSLAPQPRLEETFVPKGPLLQTNVRQVTPRSAGPGIEKDFSIRTPNAQRNLAEEDSSEPQPRSEEKFVPTGPLLETMVRQVTPRGAGPGIATELVQVPDAQAVSQGQDFLERALTPAFAGFGDDFMPSGFPPLETITESSSAAQAKSDGGCSEEDFVPSGPLLKTVVRQVTPRGIGPGIERDFTLGPDTQGGFGCETSKPLLVAAADTLTPPQAASLAHAPGEREDSEEECLLTGSLLQTILRQVTPRGVGPPRESGRGMEGLDIENPPRPELSLPHICEKGSPVGRPLESTLLRVTPRAAATPQENCDHAPEDELPPPTLAQLRSLSLGCGAQSIALEAEVATPSPQRRVSPPPDCRPPSPRLLLSRDGASSHSRSPRFRSPALESIKAQMPPRPQIPMLEPCQDSPMLSPTMDEGWDEPQPPPRVRSPGDPPCPPPPPWPLSPEGSPVRLVGRHRPPSPRLLPTRERNSSQSRSPRFTSSALESIKAQMPPRPEIPILESFAELSMRSRVMQDAFEEPPPPPRLHSPPGELDDAQTPLPPPSPPPKSEGGLGGRPPSPRLLLTNVQSKSPRFTSQALETIKARMPARGRQSPTDSPSHGDLPFPREPPPFEAFDSSCVDPGSPFVGGSATTTPRGPPSRPVTPTSTTPRDPHRAALLSRHLARQAAQRPTTPPMTPTASNLNALR